VRILVVSSYPPRHCGIGAYAHEQVDRLRAEGHEVTVLSPPDGNGDVRGSFLGGRAFHRAASIGARFDRIVVHFQPALYYRPRAPVSKIATSLALLELVLRRRPKVELLVHEADPPKLWRPDYALLRWCFRFAGTVSFHTEAERRTLERDYRVGVRSAVVPHLARVSAPPREEARRRLGLVERGPVYLCAGFLQPSKGFDRAVDAFARAGVNGSSLYILGSVRDPTPENLRYARSLAERARAVPGVTLIDRFVPDDEFDLWVVAADWVVLPYRRAWSSGVLARAHALGTPSIVSGVGGLAEQADEHDVVARDDGELVRAFAGPVRPIAGAEGPETPAGEELHHRHGGGAGPETDWDPELESVIRTRKGRIVLIAFILISVGLAAVAQLTLKHGMNQVTQHGEIPLDLGRPVDVLRRIVLNASVWAGLATFVLSAAVWLIVLSRASLSFAYPFASLTYVLILVFDRFVLKEPVSSLRYAGVALIIAGLLLISRTHQTA
jgi:glycosyltransferase involved in cell wall biosynthesis/multidrug transporter EmrE-like cation transporter